MRYILLFLLTLPLTLLAYSDYDMDGVDDKADQCPNTPFSDLVDIKGCTIKQLSSPHHFDVILGGSYSQVDYNTNEKTDTFSSSLQADYYYKNFSLQAVVSYFDSESASYSNTGLNDTFVAGYYQFKPLDALSVRVGAGAIIPTYDSGLNNNNLDYVGIASVSYAFSSMNVFGGYRYTLVNDDDYSYTDVNNNPVTIGYQNTNAYNVGLGFYPTQKLYLSGSYNASDSIYKSVEMIESASVYAFYNINVHWFSTFSYAYGLSDSASDHYASLRLGYYF